MQYVSERLEKQIRFLIEIDKVKHIFRKTKLFNKSRFENDAEHGWHLALMALVLGEYANEPVDITKVIKMVLIHDIVEIDAGDAIVYDTKLRELAQKKEREAAKRIFGILPEDQMKELIELWEEFEERQTPESKFAAAIDRFEPILQNYLTDFCTWKTHNISFAQLNEKNQHVQDGSKVIWDVVQQIFLEAKDEGYVKEFPEENVN
jgi:putative hydrolase of HD superfamily